MNIIVGHYAKNEAKTETGHGYDGWIEPENKSWVLFWDTDGNPELYYREPETVTDANGKTSIEFPVVSSEPANKPQTPA